MTSQVVIIMGSKGDLSHAQAVVKTLKTLEISYEMRVCSAHKATTRLLEILKEYENQSGPLVYITIAGRSNALSAVIDANTIHPVIASPPYSVIVSAARISSHRCACHPALPLLRSWSRRARHCWRPKYWRSATRHCASGSRAISKTLWMNWLGLIKRCSRDEQL
jgi:hypothetical protein